jgi:CLASP N terminal
VTKEKERIFCFQFTIKSIDPKSCIILKIMYGTPSRALSQQRTTGTTSGVYRSGGVHSSRQLVDGPIVEFTAIIEDTPTDNWQRRCQAFSNLVDLIPHGSAYLENGQDWYNTPILLRHLAFPISELLKDARSTVVKRVCENLIDLFTKCQIDSRYLFKDLMAAVLAVHAQTVHIIRQAVQNMILEAINEVPCKMVMPLWMERLKSDKSRTVREACALYLGRSLQCWSTIDDVYLTSEIWNQVGATLLKSLRDPSPHVRTYARAALEYIQKNHPIRWETLVSDPAGPVAKDIKLQKWLRSLENATSTVVAGADAEDLSIASRFSYNSDARFTKSNIRISSPRIRVNSHTNQLTSDHLGLHNNNATDTSETIPFNISVTHSANRSSRGSSGSATNGLPRGGITPTAGGHAPFPQALTKDTPLRSSPIKSSTANGMSKTNTHTKYSHDLEYSESNNPLDTIGAAGGTYYEGKDASTPINVLELENANKALTRSKGDAPAPNATNSSKGFIGAAAASSTSTTYDPHTTFPDGPMILSTDDLRKLASRRRSHSSLLMQELFRKKNGTAATSTSKSTTNGGVGDISTVIPEVAASSTTTQQPITFDNVMTTMQTKTQKDPPSALSVHSSTATSPGSTGDTGNTSTATSPASNSGDDIIVSNATNNTSSTISATTGALAHPPEHMVIAIRLLRAHKCHVDQIMETLKIEMDTLRDFDRLLEEPGRPTEEEVLNYFESVGLCLDQRFVVGKELQNEMDRISRGEPPEL